MYQRFFGMERKPFGVSPRLSSYCPIPDQEEAIAALRYVVLQGAGIGLVLGDAGVGKTTVCLRLTELLDPTYAIACITQTNFATVKAFYQAIHYDLGLPYFGMDEQELRLSFSDFALSRLAAGGKTVLIVDESQNLTDRILEEIRLMADAEAQDKGLIQVILAARPSLKQRLADPFFGSLRQRIAITIQLQPLSLLDTIGYVRGQIRAAGGDPERVITEDAIERVHELSGGVPRVINRICDHAFLIAFASERQVVDRDTIEAAWMELQEAEAARPIAPATAESDAAVADRSGVAGARTMDPAGAPESLLVVSGPTATDAVVAASDMVFVPAATEHGQELVVAAGEEADSSAGDQMAPADQMVPVEDPYRHLDARVQGQELPGGPVPTEGTAERAAAEQDSWDAVEIGPEEDRGSSQQLDVLADLYDALPEKQITTHPAHGQQEQKPHEIQRVARRIFSRLQRRYD